MITVTESATSEILKVLETQEDKDLGIRVYIDGVGWGGPRLGLAMDKEKDGDTRLSYEGVEYLVDSRSAEMIKKSGNVTLDYQTGEGYGSGFTVNFGEPSSGCADGCSC